MAGPELLVLARHATPAVDTDVPARDWPLTDKGSNDAQRMAELWRPLGLDLIVSSVEAKAKETGIAAADTLGLTFQTGHGLHEHERPYLGDRAEFERFMTEFFADERVHRPVEQRFTSAVDALVKAHRGLRLAIIAHGTVLSLHLAARYGADAHTTWARLGMPSYVVVETRTRTIVDLVDHV